MRFKRGFPRENDAHKNVRSISGRQTFCIGWAPISNNSRFFCWAEFSPAEWASPPRPFEKALSRFLRRKARSVAQAMPHPFASRPRDCARPCNGPRLIPAFFPLTLQPSACPENPDRIGARAQSARQCGSARARRGAAAKPQNSRPAPSARDAWQITGPSPHPNRPMPRATARAISSAALSLGMVG